MVVRLDWTACLRPRNPTCKCPRWQCRIKLNILSTAAQRPLNSRQSSSSNGKIPASGNLKMKELFMILVTSTTRATLPPFFTCMIRFICRSFFTLLRYIILTQILSSPLLRPSALSRIIRDASLSTQTDADGYLRQNAEWVGLSNFYHVLVILNIVSELTPRLSGSTRSYFRHFKHHQPPSTERVRPSG